MKFRYILLFTVLGIAFRGSAQEELPEENMVNKVFNYEEVDVKPVFGKGKIDPDEFLTLYMKYPESAIQNHTEGSVALLIVVGNDGEPTDISIVQGVDSVLNAEALRIANLIPYYSPGEKDGQKVKTRVIFPVSFKLPNTVAAIPVEETFVGTTATLQSQQENSNTPLFIVDGEHINKSIDLDANKIESIRVIKGEKAVQLYGQAGKFGVVIITTKSFPDS